ncbi:hypothetical protein ACFOUV_18445 [Oceanobacillus longus]|uniref:Transmembrane protein n=1 Tax=Oceanobacillus longus TaxID=930120 RepID=A0ABV8H4L9_9BACI
MNKEWKENMESPEHMNDLHEGYLQQPYYRVESQDIHGEERFVGPFLVPFVGALAGGLLAGAVFSPNYGYYPPYPVYAAYPPYPSYPPYPYYPHYYGY